MNAFATVRTHLTHTKVECMSPYLVFPAAAGILVLLWGPQLLILLSAHQRGSEAMSPALLRMPEYMRALAPFLWLARVHLPAVDN